MAEGSPKATGAQIAMMAAGGLIGAVISMGVLGLDGGVVGGFIGLGVALGGIPYFRAVSEWKKNQQ